MISVFTDLPLLDLKTLLVPLNPLLLHTAQSQGTMLGKSTFGLRDFITVRAFWKRWSGNLGVIRGNKGLDRRSTYHYHT
jgi:hypothetical protein